MKKYIYSLLFLCASLTGCTQGIQHNSVPESLTNSVKPISGEMVRVWGDITSEDKLAMVAEKLAQHRGQSEEKNMLALSGGGANGAFGAGVLAAWTESGQRPDFDLVTGISTGAIISVFAYLGSQYDYEIIDFYTNYTDSDLFRKKSLFSIFHSTSLLDIEPFEQMVRDTITPELLSKVASKHDSGKYLLIGTTNLDTQRLSVWNMGAIAKIGSVASEQLFENIILASTAVPGAMPAVQIDVMYNGKIYQEIHVDGGVARQVFLFPDSWDISSIANRNQNNLNIYVIRNGEFLPHWAQTEMTLHSVAARSLDTIIKYQGRSDVIQIYQQSLAAGGKFFFSHIDSGFQIEKDPTLQFDQYYMQALYQHGYHLMETDKLWHREPPIFGTQKINK
ncbi:patatin-like phospholipase family protein (plasmid) [Photobacterium sp. DA100]|uniref:patatin-like phospholipase family protein n=1 Tax=Photobacterium sp. DA100 TaxID=3027472 RepID=UPI002479B071|nr:patatin-like phospholipase family protein [Photobacterium sp. DA100]WEM45519.1 patatin-like phospholipase family protein [Photobacterium sp. DA100]